MLPISDQIDMLLGMVETLHDPDALAELADVIASHLSQADEYQAIKRLMAQLIWRGVDDDSFVAELARLRALVDDHMSVHEEAAAAPDRAPALAS